MLKNYQCNVAPTKLLNRVRPNRSDLLAPGGVQYHQGRGISGSGNLTWSPTVMARILVWATRVGFASGRYDLLTKARVLRRPLQISCPKQGVTITCAESEFAALQHSAGSMPASPRDFPAAFTVLTLQLVQSSRP